MSSVEGILSDISLLTMTKKKNKSGRPKEKVTDKVNLDVLEFLARKGFTDVEIGKVLEVDERTITRYKKDKQFLSALKKGKDQQDAEVVESLLSRAKGYSHPETKFFYDPKKGKVVKEETTKHYPPDTMACMYWLNNRQREDWRQRIEHTGEKGGPINFAVFMKDALCGKKCEKNGQKKG